MSEYGNFIKRVIERSGQPAYEFAARMGLDPTHLSAFIRGRRVGVNIETLAKMVQGISEDPAIRAGLLEAYFRDQALPEMREWVRVTPPSRKGKRLKEETEGTYGSKSLGAQLEETISRLATPTETVRALREVLEAMPGHKALEDLVQDLAAFTRDALSE
jgi:transcriptional regulator with XRE-family HTH domain